MVTNLLAIHLSSIRIGGLESLTYDWFSWIAAILQVWGTCWDSKRQRWCLWWRTWNVREGLLSRRPSSWSKDSYSNSWWSFIRQFWEPWLWLENWSLSSWDRHWWSFCPLFWSSLCRLIESCWLELCLRKFCHLCDRRVRDDVPRRWGSIYIRKKHLKAVMICWVSSGVGVMNPS